jgi:hypothetical protein
MAKRSPAGRFLPTEAPAIAERKANHFRRPRQRRKNIALESITLIQVNKVQVNLIAKSIRLAMVVAQCQSRECRF